ncbi:hypothetical protein HanXRQr2_Chr16g0762491 [Helianthus annuus]|uniref:Uncharacterized protein n=1 Tax=Helianthus annuus TaxID=4232 RepID=A0A9K3GZ74_HELAN|nr:hypothetical protein HanXRQr2_Chr16g0762491 [Helianthus annuus]
MHFLLFLSCLLSFSPCFSCLSCLVLASGQLANQVLAFLTDLLIRFLLTCYFE